MALYECLLLSLSPGLSVCVCFVSLAFTEEKRRSPVFDTKEALALSPATGAFACLVQLCVRVCLSACA